MILPSRKHPPCVMYEPPTPEHHVRQACQILSLVVRKKQLYVKR